MTDFVAQMFSCVGFGVQWNREQGIRLRFTI